MAMGEERTVPLEKDQDTDSPPVHHHVLSEAIDHLPPQWETTEEGAEWDTRDHAGESHGDRPATPKQWRPQHGEHYWEIDSDGEIREYQWFDTTTPGAHWIAKTWAFGNCFKSRAEAEHARDGIKAYLLTFHAQHA